jgi:hypothetical protein
MSSSMGGAEPRQRSGIRPADLGNRPAADPVPLRKLAGQLHCDPSNITLLSAKLELTTR